MKARPIKEQVEGLINQKWAIRISVTLESKNGSEWSVVEQTDALVTDPECEKENIQLMEMNMEELVFFLDLKDVFRSKYYDQENNTKD